ncbi:GNAT family N-acetyltransferase [Arthrobacter sp. YN]|uniref:GNAT family N-acetyltransferase n=1 Tax=Arthrobacter sp. YN TaxID=2020486 RepID=UPI000B60E033|nr:GNAT family N-acetyltransferase [Arthrobacter sp. YN]ASN21608.1 GNAT family N-acetyltransferase [Arthrobacter sp. YN]
MRTISSERLIMRPWESNDADFLFDLESRWETIRFLGPYAKPMTDRSEALQSIIRRRAIDDPIHGIWIITARDSHKLLGNLLLKPILLSAGVKGESPVEIGWHLHPDAQGAGYATEAAGAVMADAASNGLRSLVAVTDPLNAPSLRVCERLGMQSRGVTDSYYDERNLLFEKVLSR